jgi:hypothetical protein
MAVRIVLISIFSLLLSAPSFAKRPPKLEFDQIDIKLPKRSNGPFFSLDKQTNNKWLFSGYEDLSKWLIYTEFNDSFQAKSKVIELPTNTLFIDGFDGPNGEEVYFLANDGVYQVDLKSGAYHLISAVRHLYRYGNRASLVLQNFAKDINGDNIADFVLNDSDGIRVLLSQAKIQDIVTPEKPAQIASSSGEPTRYIPIQYSNQLLPIIPKVRYFDQGADFDPREHYLLDINNDNILDFSAIINNELNVFRQTNGQFDESPKIIALPSTLTNETNARFGFGNGQDQSKLSIKRPFHLQDFNNDNLIDLVVLETASEGVFEKQNTYHIHYGRFDKDLYFIDKPDGHISTLGQEFTIKFKDLNNDKLIDIYTTSVEIGFGKIVSALLSGEVDIDVRFFLQDNNNQFPIDPNIEKEAEMAFNLSSGSQSFPVIELADFNNDNLLDLLIQDDDDDLRFVAGNVKKLFNSRSRDVDIPVPKDGGRVQVVDFNNDNHSDILISFGNNDKREKQQSIVILINKR